MLGLQANATLCSHHTLSLCFLLLMVPYTQPRLPFTSLIRLIFLACHEWAGRYWFPQTHLPGGYHPGALHAVVLLSL